MIDSDKLEQIYDHLSKDARKFNTEYPGDDPVLAYFHDRDILGTDLVNFGKGLAMKIFFEQPNDPPIILLMSIFTVGITMGMEIQKEVENDAH